MAVHASFETRWVSSADLLKSLAENLLGVASYLRVHRDLDSVQLVLTEPGQKSALRRAIDDSRALPPVVFQTSDAFFSLARAATDELTVLSPFLDQQGADFLVELFALCSNGVRRSLICRPLNEPGCGDAFRRRAADFRRLGIRVFEYALPSLLPSGRETFHAKIVLADASSFYVGSSSNFMGSALDRSFEAG
jgi:phosphatidylserine/phosphatidylglycerophosphate/cardiolipin synthase-like enzyme